MKGVKADPQVKEPKNSSHSFLSTNGKEESLSETRIALLSSIEGEDCNYILSCLGNSFVVKDLSSLEAANADVLFSFGTSVIVPPEILARFPNRAYNLHAASPEYPGRDPHHWAIHDRVSRYGATLHVMTEKVDDGPIIDVEWFEVAPDTRPDRLLIDANRAAFRIIERVGPRLRRGEILDRLVGVSWSGKKRGRQDFLDMCRIETDISLEEFERRFQSFDSGSHDNLTVTIHGWTFRIDKAAGRQE